MGAIPDAVLDEIKRRTDLAALISEHVALKRSGRGFLGLCPFHQEKTPSFHVDPERGFFHCFGCNAGGNAFTFLMRVTGATFPEAARTLAARANVAVPETPRQRRARPARRGERARVAAVRPHPAREPRSARAAASTWSGAASTPRRRSASSSASRRSRAGSRSCSSATSRRPTCRRSASPARAAPGAACIRCSATG